jgi:lysophospholipase L1-like esterase
MFKNSSILHFKNLFLIFALLGTIFLIILFVHIENREEFFNIKRTDIEKNREEIEAISLGNSHNRAFYFDELNLKGLHFSDGVGSLREAIFKFETLLEELPNLKYLFMTISDSFLELQHFKDEYRINSLKNSGQNIFLENYIFNLLKYENFSRAFSFKERTNELIKEAFGKNTKKIERDFCDANDSAYKKQSYKDGLKKGYIEYFPTNECLDYLADKTVVKYRKYVEESKKLNQNVIKDNVKILEKIAKLSEENNITLFLVSTPLTKEYRKHFQKYFQKDVLQKSSVVVQNLMNKYKNIKYFNAIEFFDKYQERNTYFSDDDHLNKKGAIEFSKIFIEKNLIK